MKFGASHALRVINPMVHNHFVRRVNEFYETNRNAVHVPAPNPVSMMREDLGRLTQFPYAVAEKTDGTRYLMVMDTMNTRDPKTGRVVPTPMVMT